MKYSEKYRNKLLKETQKIKNRNNWKRKFFNWKDVLILLFFLLDFLLYSYSLISKDYTLFMGINFLLGFLISFLYFLILLLIIFQLFIGWLIYRHYLKKYKLKESNNPDTAIIIANFDIFNFKDWVLAPFHINFADICKMLLLKKWKYKIFINLTESEFDEIIYNNKFKRLFLLGHGSKTSFALNRDKTIHYSKYSKENWNQKKLKELNQKELKKDFIAQYHCNHNYGLSLADYIVDKEHRELCDITWKTWNVYKLNYHIEKLYKEIK